MERHTPTIQPERTGCRTLSLIAAMLCLALLVCSLLLVGTGTSRVHANLGRYKPPTATPTDTPTPTPTPTHTPTPTPTATATPRPTPKATVRATATTPAHITPTATAAHAAATPPKGATATATLPIDSGQTPTSVVGGSSITGNSTNTSHTPGGQPGNGNNLGLSILTSIIGTLVFLGLVSGLLLGLMLLRRRLLPSPLANAPGVSSGAQPWRRTRSGSLHSGSTLFDDGIAAQGQPQGMPPQSGQVIPQEIAFQGALPVQSLLPDTPNAFSPTHTSFSSDTGTDLAPAQASNQGFP